MIKYAHTMIRVSEPNETIRILKLIGFREIRRTKNEANRYSTIYMAADDDYENAQFHRTCELELTWNWDESGYTGGRNFGHIAFRVSDIYQACRTLIDHGVVINRPPRDGMMAFFRLPDGISIELLQEGKSLVPEEPWLSMPNKGTW